MRFKRHLLFCPTRVQRFEEAEGPCHVDGPFSALWQFKQLQSDCTLLAESRNSPRATCIALQDAFACQIDLRPADHTVERDTRKLDTSSCSIPLPAHRRALSRNECTILVVETVFRMYSVQPFSRSLTPAGIVMIAVDNRLERFLGDNAMYHMTPDDGASRPSYEGLAIFLSAMPASRCARRDPASRPSTTPSANPRLRCCILASLDEAGILAALEASLPAALYSRFARRGRYSRFARGLLACGADILASLVVPLPAALYSRCARGVLACGAGILASLGVFSLRSR